MVDAETTVRTKFVALCPVMNERMTRLWAGAEADALGDGGIAMVERATGLSRTTTRAGRDEFRTGVTADDVVLVRRPGGGRPRIEETTPGIVDALESRGQNEIRIEVGAFLPGHCRHGTPGVVEHVTKKHFVFRRTHRVAPPQLRREYGSVDLERRGIQVHPAPQQRLQFLLYRDEPESDPAPRDELDQQIDVTLGAEFPASYRAEQGKTRDTVPAAELSKPVAVNGPKHAAH